MVRPRTPALPALAFAFACCSVLAAGPARAAPSARPAPVLHVLAGTGTCAAARSPDRRAGNPCWLVFGLSGGARWRAVEVGAVYEGREPLDALSLFQLRPPAATVLGGSLAFVAEPGQRWRLSLAAEVGWRVYQDFAGSGLTDRAGKADAPYAGATGRVGFGLRPGQGRSDRMEVTLAWRTDLRSARAEVEGVAWRADGWSITMGVGLVSDW